MDISHLLTDALDHTTFSGGVSSPEDFRSALADEYWSSPNRRSVVASRPTVADFAMGPLVNALRDRLTPYLDVTTDRVGHAFRVVGDGRASARSSSDRFVENQSISSLEGVGLGLVRAAAIQGPGPARCSVRGMG